MYSDEQHFVNVNVSGVIGGIALTIGALVLGWTIKMFYNYTMKKRQERLFFRNNNQTSYMAI